MYSTKIHYDKQTQHQSPCSHPAGWFHWETERSQQNAGVEKQVADLGTQFCPNSGILTNISLSYHGNAQFQGSP